MTGNASDLRKGERFIAVALISGTFGASEMTVTNFGIAGLQISHAHPMRIGTRARVSFQRGDVTIAAQARLLWSHLSQTPDSSGKLLYVSGLRLDNPDAEYAAAIHALFRNGAIELDTESMGRKRTRMLEREEARKSQVKLIPNG
jgi:hypothetical protein